jgi:hypothetical protein
VRTLLVVLLGAVVLNLALIALALARYPSIFANERIPGVVADVILLVAYAVVPYVVANKVNVFATTALQRASWLGAGIGVLQAADITREYLLDVPLGLARPVALISLGGVMIVTLAVFGLAGAQTKNASAGALTGAWSAIMAMLLLWILAWVVNY